MASAAATHQEQGKTTTKSADVTCGHKAKYLVVGLGHLVGALLLGGAAVARAAVRSAGASARLGGDLHLLDQGELLAVDHPLQPAINKPSQQMPIK